MGGMIQQRYSMMYRREREREKEKKEGHGGDEHRKQGHPLTTEYP